MNLQEKLAVDRTWQANQRTLLAYIRTMLGIVALALALLHFFPGPASVTASATLMVGGAILMLAGVRSFLRVRRELSSYISDTHQP